MEQKQQYANIDDTYFRRFFVPIVISILVIAGVFVIVTATPGTAVEWNTTNSIFGNNTGGNGGGNMVGGYIRRLFSRRR